MYVARMRTIRVVLNLVPFFGETVRTSGRNLKAFSAEPMFLG